MELNHVVSQLESLIELLERTAEQCNRRLLRKGEVAKIRDEAHQKTLDLLTVDSVPHRIYDRETNTRGQWRVDPAPGWADAYVDHRDAESLQTRITLLRQVVNEIEPEFLRTEARERSQFYFNEGDVYKAKKRTFDVMKKSVNSLAIVDLYLDEQIFDYIESLELTLPIKLLTGKKKPIFQTLFKSLNVQRGNIEAKAFEGCHDRFIVIDGAEVWQIGASFNGFGKAAFMLNKIVDDTERTRFLADFEQWWRDGEDLS